MNKTFFSIRLVFAILTACSLTSCKATKTADHGDFALHLALEAQDNAEARRLIDGGADVNRKNERLVTPLDIAAETNNKEMIELLDSERRQYQCAPVGGRNSAFWRGGIWQRECG